MRYNTGEGAGKKEFEVVEGMSYVNIHWRGT